MKRNRISIWKSLPTILAATLPLLVAAPLLHADDEDHKSIFHEHGEDDDADYDDALEERRNGNVLPLRMILKTVGEQWPGEVLNIKVKRRGSSLHYELKVLRPNGHLTEIEVDAANGKILEVENE